MEHKEPINRKTTDAEVITVILLAACYFGGNIETSISFVRSTDMMPSMLSKSRFNRRMHRIGELLTELFLYTGEAVKSLNISSKYCIDSFPVAVCHNIRIPRCRILQGKEHRGYCASKRNYFFGFKVHVVVTSEGIPVEYTFTVGSAHDLEGMKQLPLNLPPGSELMADSAYTDYLLEEIMLENDIRLLADRKANSKYPHDPCVEYLIASQRKRVETAFSDIAKLMPKAIHAVTPHGFIIKIIAFIWAYTFNKFLSL